jgi:hypothetical protein
MKKSWKNKREIIVKQAPAEPKNAQRLERLISLLATGIERLLATQSTNSTSKLVDFQAEVLPNTHTEKETNPTENK